MRTSDGERDVNLMRGGKEKSKGKAGSAPFVGYKSEKNEFSDLENKNKR